MFNIKRENAFLEDQEQGKQAYFHCIQYSTSSSQHNRKKRRNKRHIDWKRGNKPALVCSVLYRKSQAMYKNKIIRIGELDQVTGYKINLREITHISILWQQT